MIETNLYGAVRLTQLVLPVMQAQGDGHIVFVGSTSSAIPKPGQTTYSATKAGLLTFATALRHEVAPGVRVSTVLAAWTRTPMVEAMLESPLSGMGITPDEPEIPAQAVLDTVRYDLPEVILGGPVMGVAITLYRLLPGLMAPAMRRLGAAPEYMDAVSAL
jgi:short-subunit dehydrogenase